jgi:hypothetical protein
MFCSKEKYPHNLWYSPSSDQDGTGGGGDKVSAKLRKRNKIRQSIATCFTSLI